jgi:hypothetical protein
MGDARQLNSNEDSDTNHHNISELDTIKNKLEEGDSSGIVMKISTKKKTPIEKAREALATKRKAVLSIDKPKTEKVEKIKPMMTIDDEVLESIVSKVFEKKVKIKETKRQEELRRAEIEAETKRLEEEKQRKKLEKYEAIKRKAIEEYESSRSKSSVSYGNVTPAITPVDIREKFRMLYK